MTEKQQFIVDNYWRYSAAEFAEGLEMPLSTVYQFGSDNGLRFKKVYRKGLNVPKQEKSPPGDRLSMDPKHQVPKSLQPDPKPAPLIRPAALYSNSGYEEVKRKYL